MALATALAADSATRVAPAAAPVRSAWFRTLGVRTALVTVESGFTASSPMPL
jgi:hypothetical protein